MLNVLDHLPAGLLDVRAGELHRVLRGPTLIHLPGRRPQPLFASVLLHGNEDTGWEALRVFLRAQGRRELPRAFAVFIGNVEAARHRQRFLDGQPDYNRIWTDAPGTEHLPERAMTREVLERMRALDVFASVDIHNNTGVNPHYACVRRLDPGFLQLATLFSRTVVHYRKPDGVQAEAFSSYCPAVTAECGQPGRPYGVEHAADFLHACLNLAEIPSHPVAEHDIDLYRTVAIVKVPEEASVGLDQGADIRLAADLDHLNFRELPLNTVLGHIRPGSGARLHVYDEHGRDVAGRYLSIVDGEIRTAAPVMPSMFTLNVTAIRQDCLGYLMERPVTPTTLEARPDTRRA